MVTAKVQRARADEIAESALTSLIGSELKIVEHL